MDDAVKEKAAIIVREREAIIRRQAHGHVNDEIPRPPRALLILLLLPCAGCWLPSLQTVGAHQSLDQTERPPVSRLQRAHQSSAHVLPGLDSLQSWVPNLQTKHPNGH